MENITLKMTTKMMRTVLQILFLPILINMIPSSSSIFYQESQSQPQVRLLAFVSAFKLEQRQGSAQATIPNKSPYRIVIDGGSTGSRLHIFEFVSTSSNSTTLDDSYTYNKSEIHPNDAVQCVRIGSSKAWTPLSAYGRPPSQAHLPLNDSHVAEHLLPLFEYAADAVPREYHATTQIKYQATAGMRLLDESEQIAIYDALYAGLMLEHPVNRGGSGRFVFTSLKRTDFETLGGDMEGFYGAVAANYLKGIIDVRLNVINKSNQGGSTVRSNLETNDMPLATSSDFKASTGGIVGDSNNENNDNDIDFGPLGALDMGGSSTQIVFLPGANGGLKETCLNDLTETNKNERTNVSPSEALSEEQTCTNSDMNKMSVDRLREEDFFSVSHLSFGADQFRERLWDTWVADCKKQLEQRNGSTSTLGTEAERLCGDKIIRNPCYFKGYTLENWKGYTFIGTGDAGACAKEINRLIPNHPHRDENNIDGEVTSTSLKSKKKGVKVVGGVEHPPLRGKFFAMSLYFFTLDCLRELSTHEGLNLSWPTPSIDELSGALHGLCSRSWHGDLEEIKHSAHQYSSAEVLPDRCFESVYMVTLLRDGFGFHPSSRDITFSYHVDGSEVEWSLGMALSLFAEENQENTDLSHKSDIEDFSIHDRVALNSKKTHEERKEVEIANSTIEDERNNCVSLPDASFFPDAVVGSLHGAFTS